MRLELHGVGTQRVVPLSGACGEMGKGGVRERMRGVAVCALYPSAALDADEEEAAASKVTVGTGRAHSFSSMLAVCAATNCAGSTCVEWGDGKGGREGADEGSGCLRGDELRRQHLRRATAATGATCSGSSRGVGAPGCKAPQHYETHF